MGKRAALIGGLCVAMIGCADNQPKYSVAIPVADSNVFIAETQINEQKFEIRYKTDARGNRSTKTINSEGSYTGGGRESYDEVQKEAKNRMIRNAIDQVNGVFIAGKTEVHQKSWQTSGGLSGGYEDFKDQTLSKVMGSAHLLGREQCHRESSEPGTTKIRCAGRVEVPVIDIVTLTH